MSPIKTAISKISVEYVRKETVKSGEILELEFIPR